MIDEVMSPWRRDFSIRTRESARSRRALYHPFVAFPPFPLPFRFGCSVHTRCPTGFVPPSIFYRTQASKRNAAFVAAHARYRLTSGREGNDRLTKARGADMARLSPEQEQQFLDRWEKQRAKKDFRQFPKLLAHAVTLVWEMSRPMVFAIVAMRIATGLLSGVMLLLGRNAIAVFSGAGRVETIASLGKV